MKTLVSVIARNNFPWWETNPILSRRPGTSRLALWLIGWCFLLQPAPTTWSQPEPDPLHLSIWCEFMPYAEVQTWLPVLARYSCDLILHVEKENLGDADLVRLCREARRQGVAVYAWFLLPPEQHLYLGEETLDEFADLTGRFAAWSRKKNLGVNWFVFDCEPSFLLGKRMITEVENKSPRGLARVLREECDPEKFARSLRRLNEILAGLHRQHIKVLGSANRVFLDAHRYGNTSLEDSLGVPFSRAGWDRVSFITYRYQISQSRYSGLINHYAALARRAFGERAGLDVGLLGDHSQVEGHQSRAHISGRPDFYRQYLTGMNSTRDLRKVIAIARRRGIHHINLFSLDGVTASHPGLEAWLQTACDTPPARGPLLTPRLQSARLTTSTRVIDFIYGLMVGHARYDLDAPAL